MEIQSDIVLKAENLHTILSFTLTLLHFKDISFFSFTFTNYVFHKINKH